MILTDLDLKHLPADELEDLYHDLCDKLDNTAFKLLQPGYNSGTTRAKIFGNLTSRAVGIKTKVLSNHDEYIHNILMGTTVANREDGRRPKLDLKKLLTNSKIEQIEDLVNCHKDIMDRMKMKTLAAETEIKVDEKDIDSFVDKTHAEEDDEIHYQPKVEEEKVLITMNSKLFADVCKLQDKYSIRIGDGKYFVASDEIKIVLRDPSQRPSWAIWFLSAVPLEKMPSRAALLLMPEKDRVKEMPETIPEQLIVCHASMWKIQTNKTGILLHTSWNHIAATYKWVIDKPIDVASILFKAVSHPAHLARNFGYTPNLAIPGDDWLP